MARIEVKHGSSRCPIFIGTNQGSRLVSELKQVMRSKRLFVVTDAGFLKKNRAALLAMLNKTGYTIHLLPIPSGEKSKFSPTLLKLYEWLLTNKVARHDFLLAVGGGVVTDLAGFAAATTLRGIKWGAMPTTLLGMVDAAIGGKTAINHPRGKNMIGAFWQPSFVICDINWLRTLPHNETVSGMGEVVKYAGLIGGKTIPQAERILKQMSYSNTAALTPIIEFSAAYKAKIVSQDERDGSKRLWLNLGHTFAHGIEKATGFKRLSHGMAVTLGCFAAVELSALTQLNRQRLFDTYRELLQQLIRQIPFVDFKIESVLDGMTQDKKRNTTGLRFVLLRKPGAPYIAENVDMKLVRTAIIRMQAIYREYGKTDA